MSRRLPMSLSLDLDNKWSYLKTHGDDSWKEFPSYLDVVVPRILEFLRQRDLKITFFVVGQDAAHKKNHAALKLIVDAGHEVCNHSYNHEPWLHLYSENDLDAELQRAEVAIEAATGVKVKGFRGPGFSLSKGTLSVLNKRGYEYDATAFPNILNPLARAYFFSRSKLTKEEKEQRKALFGSFSDAFRPVKPYRWSVNEQTILELPVTTMPIFKTPIHFSYLIYLASYSKALAYLYANMTVALCCLTRTEPSLLLHPLDFMGKNDDPDLDFFPGMSLSSHQKLTLLDGFFRILLKRFKPLTMGEHIAEIKKQTTLKVFKPEFSHSRHS